MRFHKKQLRGRGRYTYLGLSVDSRDERLAVSREHAESVRYEIDEVWLIYADQVDTLNRHETASQAANQVVEDGLVDLIVPVSKHKKHAARVHPS